MKAEEIVDFASKEPASRADIEEMVSLLDKDELEYLDATTQMLLNLIKNEKITRYLVTRRTSERF